MSKKICKACGKAKVALQFEGDRNTCRTCRNDDRRNYAPDNDLAIFMPSVQPKGTLAPEVVEFDGKYIPASFYERGFPEGMTHVSKHGCGTGATTAFRTFASQGKAGDTFILIEQNRTVAEEQYGEAVKTGKLAVELISTTKRRHKDANCPELLIYCVDSFLEARRFEAGAVKMALVDEWHRTVLDAGYRNVFVDVEKKITKHLPETPIITMTATPATVPDIQIRTNLPPAGFETTIVDSVRYLKPRITNAMLRKDRGLIIHAPDREYVRTLDDLARELGVSDDITFITGESSKLESVLLYDCDDNIVLRQTNHNARIIVTTSAGLEGWSATAFDEYDVFIIAYQGQPHTAMTPHDIVQLLGRVRTKIRRVVFSSKMGSGFVRGKEKALLDSFASKKQLKDHPLEARKVASGRRLAGSYSTDAGLGDYDGDVITLHCVKSGTSFKPYARMVGGVLRSDLPMALGTDHKLHLDIDAVVEHLGGIAAVGVMKITKKNKGRLILKPFRTMSDPDDAKRRTLTYIAGDTISFEDEKGLVADGFGCDRRHIEFADLMNGFTPSKVVRFDTRTLLNNEVKCPVEHTEYPWPNSFKRLVRILRGRQAVYANFDVVANDGRWLDSVDRFTEVATGDDPRLDRLVEARMDVYRDRRRVAQDKLRKLGRYAPNPKLIEKHTREIEEMDSSIESLEDKGDLLEIKIAMVFEMFGFGRTPATCSGFRWYNVFARMGGDYTAGMIQRSREFGVMMMSLDLNQMSPRCWAHMTGSKLDFGQDLYTQVSPEHDRAVTKKAMNNTVNSTHRNNVTQKMMSDIYIADPAMTKDLFRTTSANGAAWTHLYTAVEEAIIGIMREVFLVDGAWHSRLHDEIIFDERDVAFEDVPRIDIGVKLATYEGDPPHDSMWFDADSPERTKRYIVEVNPAGFEDGRIVHRMEIKPDIFEEFDSTAYYG